MTAVLHIADDLALPLEAATRTFAILGQKGSGKTTAAVVLVEELLARAVPVVVIDPTGAWWGLRASRDGRRAGVPITVLGGDHGDLPLEPSAGAVVADLVADAGPALVLDLEAFSVADQHRFVTAFAERLYEKNRRPVHLVIDESDEFIPQRAIHGAERMVGALDRVVRRGRKKGIGVSLISQRAAALHKNVLTQVDVLVALRTTGKQDIEAIDAWMTRNGSDAQRADLLRTLDGLPVGTGWVWSPGWLRVFRRVAFRDRTTFDSSATPTVGAASPAPKKLAAVDLEQVRVAMAATIERARADDPKALRARIAELERAAAAHRNLKPEKVIERVEVPTLSEKDVARIDASARGAEAAAEILREAAQTLRDALRDARTPSPLTPRDVAAPARTVARPAAAAARSDARSTLGSGERRVLTAIAQHGVDGCAREQLTVLTGYKRSSRDTYLQRLKARRMVDDADMLRATDAGIAALGSGFVPLPTGDALRAHWMDRLPEGERRVLEVVCDAHPRAVSRDAISERTGYKRSSRDTYLQRLGARRLVGQREDGIVASDALFGGG